VSHHPTTPRGRTAPKRRMSRNLVRKLGERGRCTWAA
jgi:hypothetical protein